MIPGRYDTSHERRRVLARHPWTTIIGIYAVTLGVGILVVAMVSQRADNAAFGAVVVLVGGALFRVGVGRRRRRARE